MAGEPIVTAAALVIGDEILSGRTKDRNIDYIAAPPDARRHPPAARCASSPTTKRRSSRPSTSCARATPISSPPAASVPRTTTSPPTPSPRRSASPSTSIARALELLQAYFKKRGVEPTPARLRMARIPARRRAHPQRDLGRAGLHDRQRHRARRRARGDAGDARRRDAAARDREQIANGDDQIAARGGRGGRSLRRASTNISGCCDGQLSRRSAKAASARNSFCARQILRVSPPRATASRLSLRPAVFYEFLAAMRRSGAFTHRPAILSPLPAAICTAFGGRPRRNEIRLRSVHADSEQEKSVE